MEDEAPQEEPDWSEYGNRARPINSGLRLGRLVELEQVVRRTRGQSWYPQYKGYGKKGKNKPKGKGKLSGKGKGKVKESKGKSKKDGQKKSKKVAPWRKTTEAGEATGPPVLTSSSVPVSREPPPERRSDGDRARDERARRHSAGASSSSSQDE